MKNEKGITLIVLIVTIIVLIILTFTITVNIDQYVKEKEKSNFEKDMLSLREEINQYYARVKELPIINRYTNLSMLNGIKNINDNDEYYVLDIRQLDVKLNNGADYIKALAKQETEPITDLLDIYIINKQSHTIYYPKGVEFGGRLNYRLPEVYSEI